MSLPTAAEQYARISAALELRRYAQVRAEAAAWAASDPGDPRPFLFLAHAHLGLGEAEAAARAGAQAVVLAPADPRGFVVLSMALQETGDRADATEAAKEAVRLAPHDPAGHQALAYALADRRWHSSAARRAARHAVRLNPHDPDTWQALGYVLRKKSRRKARAAYRRALALEPGNPVARQNLAASESRWSPSTATEGFADALAIDPTMSVARENLERSVTASALFVLFVAGACARAIFPSEHLTMPVKVTLFSVLVLLVLVVTVRRMPSGVRRNPGRFLLGGLPGLRTPMIAFALSMLVLGTGLTLMGLHLAGDAAVAVTVIGVMGASPSTLWLALALLGRLARR